MLLWEAVSINTSNGKGSKPAQSKHCQRLQRLPFELRCAAITRSGRRCRGKIRQGSDFCPFHDPAVSREQRRRNAAKGGRNRRQLAHLPDGYLRKLTNRTAVGHCMDRLYREVRLGIITIEMGAVLFNILCRLLDSELFDGQAGTQRTSRRSKADRFRPKLSELLTPEERKAWREAVENAPALVSAAAPQQRLAAPKDRRAISKTPRPDSNEMASSLVALEIPGVKLSSG